MKPYVLILMVLAGLFLLSPRTQYQPMLSTGDHGRDLYAFSMTLEGHLPYRDYWWVYGPLMPYVYAGLMKIFGVSIHTVLWAKAGLVLAGGIFFCLTLSLFPLPLLFCCVGTLWFWTFSPGFFFTYNHAGGITLIMAVAYALVSHLCRPKPFKILAALMAVFLLGLVKIEFGVTAWTMLLVAATLARPSQSGGASRRNTIIFRSAVVICPLLWLLIYGWMLHGLPLHELRQCFPYLGADHPHHMAWGESLRLWASIIRRNITATPANLLFALLLGVAVLQVGAMMRDGRLAGESRRRLLQTLGWLAAFYALNSVEFFMSGIRYRLNWAIPFSSLMVMLLIGTAVTAVPRWSRWGLYGFMLTVILLHECTLLGFVRKAASSPHQLNGPRADVLVGNDPQWLDAVNETTRFLQSRLSRDELFLALPYDPLFYFLMDKPSPTRQLIVFQHINITPEQEDAIIRELEEKGVNYVVLSNRMASPERGLGRFGVTHCRRLAEYLATRFQEVARFGDWEHQPGWGWNYGTLVLKRIAGGEGAP